MTTKITIGIIPRTHPKVSSNPINITKLIKDKNSKNIPAVIVFPLLCPAPITSPSKAKKSAKTMPIFWESNVMTKASAP